MKVYFKNLDGIRFFAAFIVLLHHAFYFKHDYSPGIPFVNDLFRDAGRIGVNLFFILSGFLISYLLLVEKDKTGTVSYRKFYVRRILRIWPLYLGYGLICTLLGPIAAQWLNDSGAIELSTILINILYLLFFAVNIQLAFQNSSEGVFQISWSVCIEEQFYLIWPILMNVFRKKLVKLFLFMFCIRLSLRILIKVLPLYFNVSEEVLIGINYLLIFDKLDLFGGGMLMAILYYNKANHKKLFDWMLQPAIQYIMITITLLYIFSLIYLPKHIGFFADHTLFTILFGYVLLAAVSENSVLALEHPILRTLGKISYGIYLFHVAVCQVTIFVFKKLIGHPDSFLVYDVLYPAVCSIITFLIAYFSYEYYEKVFLTKKNKYAVVATRV